MAKKPQKPPEQAISPISGTAPPTEHRFKPGQSGNPKGRPKSAGATIREWINSLAERDLSCGEIRKIARNEKLPWTQRAAAERILRTMEAADIADFAGLIRGENNLEDLKAMGVNTEAVKKLKQKTRKVYGNNDAVEEIIEREIELYDRAGTDFDRVMDRTEGKAGQTIVVTGGDGGPIQSETTVKHVIDYDTIRDDLATFARSGPYHGGVSSNGNGKSVHTEVDHAN